MLSISMNSMIGLEILKLLKRKDISKEFNNLIHSFIHTYIP